MWKRLLPLLILSSASFAQQETIPIQWDPVEGATGYSVFISKSDLECPRPSSATNPARILEVDAEAHTGYVLTGLLPDTEYNVAVKAMSPGGLSANCSNVLKGWPTPRVIAIDTTLPEYVGYDKFEVGVLIQGRNFKPDPQGMAVFVDYPTVQVVKKQFLNTQNIRVTLRYGRDAPGGELKLWIVNNDGSSCEYSASARYDGCVKVMAGTIQIVPIALPGDVSGLDWWLGP